MGKIQTSIVYSKVENAIKKGFTTISSQGSSRSSKTYNILIWLIKYCLEYPNIRLSICRKTLPSLRSSVLIDFKEILIRMNIYDDKYFNKTNLIYILPNGSWVEFFSTDDEQKIRGRKRDILFVNEASELSFMEWEQLKMRTTRFSIIDYNPSFTNEHWIYELNKDKRTYHFITTYKDNPFLQQEVITEIESLKEKNEGLWKVFGLGEMAVIEGLIFKDYTVLQKIPDECTKLFIGMDFGFSNDPTAIVEVGFLGDSMYIDELCYRTEMLSKDIIRELKEQCPNKKIISESADPRLVREIRNAGLNIHPVEKFKGSVDAGLNKMFEYKLCITKRSVNVIKEVKNYTYQHTKDDKWLNVPIDLFNHSIDAARYVVLMEILGKTKNRGVKLRN